MNPLFIYLSIANSVATGLLQNKSDPGKVSEWAGYLNFASALAERWASSTPALQVLDDQLKEAIAANRGLTAEQRAAWRKRDDVVTDEAIKWLADHPDTENVPVA